MGHQTFAIFLILSAMVAEGSFAALYLPLPSDPISLNAAVTAANLSLEDDIIDLRGSIYTYTTGSAVSDGGITALPAIGPSSSSGKLSIINGNIKRSYIAGTASFRLIFVSSGADLSLYNLTLENAFNNGFAAAGAGGAIRNLGNLTLINCNLSNNTSFNSGGAIANGTNASVYIKDSIITKNLVTSVNIGIGGGISNSGNLNLTVVRSTISENTISTGSCNGAGIGIAGGSPTTTVIDSTISNNTCSATNFAAGGGISNVSGVLTVQNSTIYGNRALGGSGGDGGGIRNGGTLSLNNNTITANVASGRGGGIFVGFISPIIALNSNIIANNTAATGSDFFNLGSPVTNNGYNMFTLGGTSGYVPVATDIVTTVANLSLGPLQDNGGPTYTVELLPGSLAINNGINPLNFAFDQRGNPYYRSSGGATDIGAYEFQF